MSINERYKDVLNFSYLKNDPFILLQRARTDAIEAEIRAAMERENCSVEDLTLELHYFPSPRYTVRRVTAEEKWLNWLSSNHGCGTSHD